MSPDGEADMPALVLRVLVVEDNLAAAQTAGWTLEMMDCEIRLAHNAAEALAAAQVFQPHIALLDIGLPGTNGYDLCIQMRRLPELARTVFAAQTGWDGQAYRLRAQEAGFDHYLVKPVPFEVLQALIAAVRQQFTAG